MFISSLVIIFECHDFNIQFLSFLGDIPDQIEKQFNSYSIIKPKLIHSKHKREIQSTKTNPVSIFFFNLLSYKQ